MSRLFEDSDSDVDLQTNNEYAKNYEIWRKKEELNRLKTKYGEHELKPEDAESSSSSEDDEIGIELTEEVEKDFYKTLALLKKKDPKIYDDNAVFFSESTSADKKSQKKKSDENETMFIKDYERKLLLEKGGIVGDTDDEDENIQKEKMNPTYVEEQRKIKESLKKVAQEDDSDNEEWGGMFKVRQKDKELKEKAEADYKAWLAGQKKKLGDEETAASLKPLKEYWGNPNLEDGEKFLRDYILQKRYLDNENEDYVPTYDEVVHDSDENFSEDEKAVEKQEEFEHKYNFRFEEPDQEFIKRFPRTMENSLRKEDNRRKLKRVETKERKAKEKSEKMEDLRKLRDLKRKEIEEKIEKLKEITGNNEMAFNDDDIDGDFDPEAHDKRMQALFNDDFYEGPEEDQKPKFDLDGEDGLDLEIENFDNWSGNAEGMGADYEPHCEDENFIMDADYDPQATQKELLENSKGKKKRRRKSKFVEMLAKDRPNFDPTDKKYEQYIDEYYKFDCEDIVGDIPCKFKYRKVVPNSFGLSIEEILVAKDRELNKWCSLKKAVQIRPDHVEKYDQIAFSKKAQNEALKKKMLPSLFAPDDEEESKEIEVRKEEMNTEKNITRDKKVNEAEIKKDDEESSSKTEDVGDSNKRKRKIKKNKTSNIPENTNSAIGNTDNSVENNKSDETNVVNNKKKLEKREDNQEKVKQNPLETNKQNKKKKKKNKKKSEEMSQSHENNQGKVENNPSETDKQNKKRKKKNKNKQADNSSVVKNPAQKRKASESVDDKGPVKKFKKNKMNKLKKEKPDVGLSDARLAAYGLNPKKFKKKAIYGNKDKNKTK